MAEGLTLRAVALFVVVVAGQILGSVSLVKTAGFTHPGWSVACAAIYALSLYCLALLLNQGAPLSLLMPLMAAIVPIVTILIAVLVLREGASMARLGLLLLSCAIVGLASRV
jgi:quaternary ammonium compound-resistance protein SugE